MNMRLTVTLHSCAICGRGAKVAPLFHLVAFLRCLARSFSRGGIFLQHVYCAL
jgi:hypothetical protein